MCNSHPSPPCVWAPQGQWSHWYYLF